MIELRKERDLRLKPPEQTTAQEVKQALDAFPLDLTALELSLGRLRTRLEKEGHEALASIIPDRIIHNIRVTGDTYTVPGEEEGVEKRRETAPLLAGLADDFGSRLTKDDLVRVVKHEGYAVSTLAATLVRMEAVARSLDVLSASGDQFATEAVRVLRKEQSKVQSHVGSSIGAMMRCAKLRPAATELCKSLEDSVRRYADSTLQHAHSSIEPKKPDPVPEPVQPPGLWGGLKQWVGKFFSGLVLSPPPSMSEQIAAEQAAEKAAKERSQKAEMAKNLLGTVAIMKIETDPTTLLYGSVLGNRQINHV